MLSKILKYFLKSNSIPSMYHRGYEIWLNEKGEEIYLDTGEKTNNDYHRPCKRCGQEPTPDGYDACLGELPGVEYACCGHGKEGYTKFRNGVVIRGNLKVETEEDRKKERERLYSLIGKN